MIIYNKHAQFETKLLAIILIFIVGIILLFLNRVNTEIYGSFDKYFNESETLNNTEAHQALKTINAFENSSMWDYAFLAIYIGFILQVVLFSFATRINLAFYWILIVLDVPTLLVAVVLSNIWQSIAVNPQFVSTIARFPITNLLLGSYYPIAALVIIFLGSILLFGKKDSSVGGV